jgi:two-component system nitrate/nitrite response regulator NarL
MVASRRVLIVGEDSLALAGLERVIEGADGARVLGVVTLSSAAVAREVGFEEQPDAILWDLGASGDSDSLVPNLVERYPTLALVPDEASARAALAAGARGALLRGRGVDQLVGGLDAVLSGLVVIDEELASDLLRRPPLALPSREELTPREREVLEQLALGLTNREIAERLGVSPHTAKFHVNSLLGKLGATSRTEAVAIAVRSGLVSL